MLLLALRGSKRERSRQVAQIAGTGDIAIHRLPGEFWPGTAGAGRLRLQVRFAVANVGGREGDDVVGEKLEKGVANALHAGRRGELALRRSHFGERRRHIISQRRCADEQQGAGKSASEQCAHVAIFIYVQNWSATPRQSSSIARPSSSSSRVMVSGGQAIST